MLEPAREIEARREVVAGPFEHDNAHTVVAVGVGQGALEFLPHLDPEGVGLLGAVEPYGRDAAGFFVLDHFVRHVDLPVLTFALAA